METGLILATLVVFMAIGASHLSFAANATKVNITRTGCGSSKLCVETPNGCDPAANSSCLFTSIVASAPVAPNGVNLSFQLSGNSSGYIAVGLTANASEGSTMLFVCAQNSSENGTLFFRTMTRNNTQNTLSSALVTMKETNGLVQGDKIQCEFNVPKINASQTRSQDTTYTVLIGSGPLNGADLGAFSVGFTSARLNLADPASNVPNATQAPNTTTTMSGASDCFHSNAVLLLLSVLALSLLKSA